MHRKKTLSLLSQRTSYAFSMCLFAFWHQCIFLLLPLSTLVPDCSPASWTDPIVQHGCQAGGSEGPGKCVPRHHLRPRVHQPGRHLPAHSDGGKWDWVSQLSVHLFCCFGFPLSLLSSHHLRQFLIPLCMMNFIGKMGNSRRLEEIYIFSVFLKPQSY